MSPLYHFGCGEEIVLRIASSHLQLFPCLCSSIAAHLSLILSKTISSISSTGNFWEFQLLDHQICRGLCGWWDSLATFCLTKAEYFVHVCAVPSPKHFRFCWWFYMIGWNFLTKWVLWPLLWDFKLMVFHCKYGSILWITAASTPLG